MSRLPRFAPFSLDGEAFFPHSRRDGQSGPCICGDRKPAIVVFALEALPAPIGSAAFVEMAAQMRSEGEDIGLTAAVAALVHPKMV